MILEEYIYLAGNISNDVETYHWRERFEDYMDDINVDLIQKGIVDYPVFHCLNPCSNAFNEEFKANINILRTDPSEHLGLLPTKDHWMLKRCTIVVANLALWTIDKPMMGTLFEESWNDWIFRMPNIQIVGDESSPYTQHIFVKKAADARVFDEKEAAQVIAYFFAPKSKRRERRAEDTVWD